MEKNSNEPDDKHTPSPPKPSPPTKSKKKFEVVPSSDEDDSEDDSDLENRYLAGRHKKEARKAVAVEAADAEMGSDEDADDVEDVSEDEASDVEVSDVEVAEAPATSDEEDEDDASPVNLVHESLLKGGKSKSRSGKQKFVPSEETPEKRDQRTIFVGNLPIDVAKKRVRIVALDFLLYPLTNLMTAPSKAIPTTHPHPRPHRQN